jgi:hypothetical protein
MIIKEIACCWRRASPPFSDDKDDGGERTSQKAKSRSLLFVSIDFVTASRTNSTKSVASR